MLLYLLLGLLSIALTIFIIGILLPKEIIVTKQTTYNHPPEVVYNVVTDNNNWHYRSSVEDLQIIDKQDDIETWTETTGGTIITFKTLKKTPHCFYSFDMDCKMFDGYWTGEFKNAGAGKTLFIATELIRIKNPFVKVMAYFFFDIDKLMEDYQNDLAAKLNELTIND